MAQTIRFDHVGITVRDLDSAIAFFIALGLEVEGRTVVEGEFIEIVTGIPGAASEIVMMRFPGGGTALELSSFIRPDPEPGLSAPMANQTGIRSVALQVKDLQACVERLASEGYALIGGIGEYENAWRMAYVRGPEDIIVALAEQLE